MKKTGGKLRKILQEVINSEERKRQRRNTTRQKVEEQQRRKEKTKNSGEENDCLLEETLLDSEIHPAEGDKEVECLDDVKDIGQTQSGRIVPTRLKKHGSL